MLEAFGQGAWEGQYAFTSEPFEKPDFEVINWHIGTDPRSPFTRCLYVQRTHPDAHLHLMGRLLTQTRADGTAGKREFTDEVEVRRVLDEDFGITAPEGTALPT